MASVETVSATRATVKQQWLVYHIYRAALGEWQIILIGVIALVARLWGIGFGLPYALHPDEPVVNGTVVRMLQNHTANPANFIYPSAVYYYFALIGIVYQFVTGMSIATPPDETTGVGLYPNPLEVLCTRVGVTLLGIIAIVIVYLVARRLVGKWFALAAALLLALSPLHIDLSQIATTDAPSAAGLALAAALCVVAARKDTVWAFWLAGLALGLATGIKYNAIAGGIMLVAAYGVAFWRRSRASGKTEWRAIWRDPRLLGFVLIPVAFLITTPYALIHPKEFYDDVASIYLHYGVQGHLGSTGSSVLFTLNDLFASGETLLSVLAVIGVISAIVRRRLDMIIIAIGALTYFVVVAVPKVHFTRNLVPLWPLLAILAAEGIAALMLLIKRFTTRASGVGLAPRYRFVATAALVVLLAAAFLPTLGRTVQLDSYRSATDLRITASQWIEHHIPAGASFAIEPYSVTLDHGKYRVQFMIAGLYTKPLGWYAAHNIEYVVASQMFYYRFFNTTVYPTERSVYVDMFTHWQTVKIFTGPEVVGGSSDGKLVLLRVVGT